MVMKPSCFRMISVTASVSLLASLLPAGESPSTEFARDVYPILRRACFDCHGADKQEAALRLDSRDAALESAFSSGLIVPGKPSESELLRRLTLPSEDDEIMPAIGAPLSKPEVEIIRRWIEQGAAWPEKLVLSKHWSYVKPTRPKVPQLPLSNWPRGAIDHFVLRKLKLEGLEPSPSADRTVLIRRLYLDIIGLPPSPAEVDDFLADESEDAYEQLVDRLLAKPQFGERWGRPWLDLARYADSHGFQRDNLRDHWAYRDWVIDALNDDMPFDRFTVEQIAGDLLPSASESQKIATGFHRCAPTNVEAGSLPEETRIEQVFDRVNTTGAVWLGTTLECCQCHDHKYDPFSQRDYYRLLAYYNNTEAEADRSDPKVPSSIAFLGPKMKLSNAERDARRQSLQNDLAAAKQESAQRRSQIQSQLESQVARLASRATVAPQTHVLPVKNFESTGVTDSHQLLQDGSVLLVGDDPPSRDTYSLTLQTELVGIRALKLEALADDSLPGGGPGRGDPQRTNFVLNTFSVANRPSGSTAAPEPIQFSKASASFSQQKWDVAGAFDSDPKSGWAIAPKFGQSHWAVFETTEPVGFDGGTELVVTVTHNYGGARSIGRLRISALTGDLGQTEIPADVADLLTRAPDHWKPADRKRLLDYCVSIDPSSIQLRRRAAELQKQIAAAAPDTTLIMRELAEPRQTSVFERGDYRNLGERVEPGTPSILPPVSRGPANRLALAKWLVDRENPLVARVTVNRWWAEVFGRGIVKTVEDFGIQGAPPTHPELLDWLAVEFMASGWSMKHLLKQIFMSATYRQSSKITPQLLARDDQNSLYARGPMFRMDAEMLRDNALSIAGLICLEPGGPPIRPYQPKGVWTKVGGNSYDYVVSPGNQQYRRGIYVVLKRGAPYPSFTNFDATARLTCTVRRSRTNTPLQALTLLNDPVYVEAAAGLARRALTQSPGHGLDDRLIYAFRVCTSRQPSETELSTLRRLFQSQLKASRRNQAATQKLVGEFPMPQGVEIAEFAAWHAVATALLNLHETITKG